VHIYDLYEVSISSFYVHLLTGRQTDKQTSKSKQTDKRPVYYITAAEVITATTAWKRHALLFGSNSKTRKSKQQPLYNNTMRHKYHKEHTNA